jgi:predicted nuclease with TOPRIM domain
LREQLQQRLEELKQEFESGQARLRELEVQEARLREMLLRISGAIQVLEETLTAGTEQNAPPA